MIAASHAGRTPALCPINNWTDCVGHLVLAAAAFQAALPIAPVYLAPGRYVRGDVTFIPYYVVQPTSMEVWIPYRESR
jgi:uncharacterized protein (DUF1919 family)